IARKDYPAILVTTSLNDSQVLFHEPTKYVARLRAMKTDGNVLLLKCNMDAGHGGASGRYESLPSPPSPFSFGPVKPSATCSPHCSSHSKTIAALSASHGMNKTTHG
ncbi:hypothetical protein E3A20_23970, partial [Planctomyces bekefii]